MAADRTRREFVKQASIAAVTTTVLANTAFGADANYVTAETTLGKVRGVDEGGIKTFRGIPYGENTAGKNRFMPPRVAPKWTGVKDTFKYGYSAPQNEPGKPVKVTDVAVAGAGLTAENEDCLVLNVWTPGVNDGQKRPVMFWCHGGGFESGSGSSPITAGHNLSRRGDVVVITINHRLNVLGFCNLSAAGGPDFAESGDAGMMDVVMALNWVKDNAAQFGGDPDMVTVFGQSGGGSKVSTLLAMPSAKGLFRRAIIESGPSLKAVDPQNGEKAAAMLMANLGVKQARDLQTIPVNKIMTAYFAVTRSGGAVFAPNLNSTVLPQNPFSPTASPISADVPVMVGNTRTEWTTFSDDASFTLDEAGMRARIQKLLGADANHVIDVYQKANPGAKPSEIYFLIVSDHMIGTPTLKLAERRAALHAGPVYLYYFSWLSPLDGGKYMSPHTVEIPFAWDTIKTAALTKDAPDAQALSDKVSAAWLAFARTGNPNVPSLLHWPVFETTNWPTMVFDNESKAVNDPLHAQRIAMFDAMKG